MYKQQNVGYFQPDLCVQNLTSSQMMVLELKVSKQRTNMIHLKKEVNDQLSRYHLHLKKAIPHMNITCYSVIFTYQAQVLIEKVDPNASEPCIVIDIDLSSH
jgi:hypothetical protein